MQGGHKLVDARNWCLVEELPYTQETQSLKGVSTMPQGKREWLNARLQAIGSTSSEGIREQKTSGALLYRLRVEDPINQTATPRSYDTICPLYIWNPMSKWLRRSTSQKVHLLRTFRLALVRRSQSLLRITLWPPGICSLHLVLLIFSLSKYLGRWALPQAEAIYICGLAGSHMSVRPSFLLQSCMCMPKTKEVDPLKEL